MKILGKWIFAVIFFICLLTPATVMTVSADDGIEPGSQNVIETEVPQEVTDVITEEITAAVSGDDKEECVSDQKSGINEAVTLDTESNYSKNGEEVEEETETDLSIQKSSEDMDTSVSTLEDPDIGISEEAVNESVMTEENGSAGEAYVSVSGVSADGVKKDDEELVRQNKDNEISNESSESVVDTRTQPESEYGDLQKPNFINAMEKISKAVDTETDNQTVEESNLPVNAALMTSSNDSTESDYEYTISDNQVTIKKYNGLASILNIPEEITGYSITKIDANPE